MKIEEDEIVFSSGRREYAHCGIVGLSPDMNISYGYDGVWEHDKWTPEEKRELADFMIEQWKAYRATL